MGPRGFQHEAVARTNTQLFSMYRVKPSSAGYRVPGDMSILESTLHSLSESEGLVIDVLGKMTKYEKDGNGGELIVRNMARAMQCWDTERVQGEFYIARIAKSGTLVVKKGHEYGKLMGDVYLIKGIGNQVGDQVPKSKLPLLVRTTFLPLYNFLVYDGLMLVDERMPMTPSFKKKIEKHVDRAIREDTVIYCGKSAAQGLWDKEPPEIVKPVPSGELKLAAPKEDKGEGSSYEPTPKQNSLATKTRL